MGLNRISASIDDESIERVHQALEEVRLHLPFLLELAGGERPSLINVGENLAPFLEKTLADASQHPDLVPPYLDMEELQRDIELFSQLKRIIVPLQRLLDLTNDTHLAAGSDAFDTAIIFYKNVRMEAKLGDANAQRILDDLKESLPFWKKAI